MFAKEYQLYDRTTGDFSFKTIRSEFRINSASFTPTTTKNFWPNTQSAPQVVMDADGDITVSYDGFGPDVMQEDVSQALRTTLLSQVKYSGQDLTFTLNNPNEGGFFQLTLEYNGTSKTTGNIYFDPYDLNQTAANILAALNSLGFTPDPFVTSVVYDPSTTSPRFLFHVTFATLASSTVLPLIKLHGAQQTLLTYQTPFAEFTDLTDEYVGQGLSFQLKNLGQGGHFRLMLDGKLTGDIRFNPANPGQAAADILTALNAIEPVLRVIYDTDSSDPTQGIYNFGVVFGSTLLGIPVPSLKTSTDRPLISIFGASTGTDLSWLYFTTPFAVFGGLDPTTPAAEFFGQSLEIDLTDPKTGGWFTLTLDGIQTADIQLDPAAKPADIAAAIQRELAKIEPGTTVTDGGSDPASGIFLFNVTFQTSATASYRPKITIDAPTKGAHVAIVTTKTDVQLTQQAAFYKGQILSFSMPTATTSGWFRLTLDGELTDNIFFDPNDLAKTASDIQTALAAIEAGTTVAYDPLTSEPALGIFNFQVKFTDRATATGRTLITYVPLTPLAAMLNAVLTGRVITNATLVSDWEDSTLLRGDANGALFSQFDTDPTLQTTPTALSSDNIANNNRDGQDTVYLLGIAQDAVSGNFTVSLSVAGGMNADGSAANNSTTVVINPVYFPNGGPIDPVKTMQAIHDALSAATIVGKNWPQTGYGTGGYTGSVFEGPISVTEIDGNLSRLKGTAWDPLTQGMPDGQYIYEIVFLGEVHDSAVTMAVTNSTMLLGVPSKATRQQLTFTEPNNGWFGLSVNGLSTQWIQFNGAATASDITLQLGFVVPGAVCQFDSVSADGKTYTFTVTFPTAQSPISFVSHSDLRHPGLAGTRTVTLAGAGSSSTPTALCEYFGFSGTMQYNTSIAMTSSGDFVMVWNEAALTNNGAYTNNNLYFRTFDEGTDTAGPLVTDFILPAADDAGQAKRVNEGDTVTDHISTIVVTFDEDMMTTGANSVTNVDNWALMCDGAIVPDGISKIYFGMNEGSTRLGTPASNKWEAVLYLNSSGDSQSVLDHLADGHYEIVATTNLRDKAGNALGRTGYKPDGAAFTRSFDVVLPTGVETLVNPTTTTTGSQSTAAPNSQAVASNANGDSIVVWTSNAGQSLTFQFTGSATSGWFKLTCDGKTTDDIQFFPDGLVLTASNIQAALSKIESGITVAYNSVLSDATGKFVFDVTFSASSTVTAHPSIALVAPSSSLTGINATCTAQNVSAAVYATLYDAKWTTNAAGDRVSSPSVSRQTLVTDNSTACNASVACDASGDFVVTWSQRDNGDWNIWAARFDAAGNQLKMYNTVSKATAVGPVRVNTTIADAQQYSTVAMDAEGGFVIVWQSMNQDGGGWGIYAQRYDMFGQPVSDQTSVEGSIGEFRVNDTTVNDQVYAAVAMNASGAFVITWTGYGQDGDDSYHGNVYAKTYQGGQGSKLVGSSEFLVNQRVTDDQKWSSVAMDAAGAFAITWTSYGQDGGGAGPGASVNGLNGVYVRRYDSSGKAFSSEFCATTFTANDQEYSRIAMDAIGNFVVVWQSYQDRTLFNGTAILNTTDSASSFGIYGQRYVNNSLVGATSMPGTGSPIGTNGEYMQEFAVNTTKDGDQQFPSISMDDTGDFVVVWSGNGKYNDKKTDTVTADNQGVFLQRYDQPVDIAGARAIITLNATTTPPEVVAENQLLKSKVEKFVVTFTENLIWTTDETDADWANSVCNTANWRLMRNGVAIVGGVKSVEWRAIPESRTYEATVTFDSDPSTSIPDALGSDVYTTFMLTASRNIHDLAGNALDGNTDGFPGDDFSRIFSVDLSVHPVPVVVGTQNATTIIQTVVDGQILENAVTKFVVAFNTDLSTLGGVTGVNSVINPSNWGLTRDGSIVTNGVATVQFGLSEAYVLGLASVASGKYEAVVTFDSDATLAGDQSLGEGHYVLTIRGDIQDKFGNALDGNNDNVLGGDFVRKFSVEFPVPSVYATYNATSGLQPVVDNEVMSGTVTKFLVSFKTDMSTVGGSAGTHSILNLDNWGLTWDGIPIAGGVTSVAVRFERGLSRRSDDNA